jgi:hypothetical protein
VPKTERLGVYETYAAKASELFGIGKVQPHSASLPFFASAARVTRPRPSAPSRTPHAPPNP